jgi:Papain-like cysteine protease AvrRpt2
VGILEETRAPILGPGFGGSYVTAPPPVVALDRRLAGFVMEKQLQRYWCWAAVTVSAHTFYGDAPVISQCGLASVILGIDCCSAGCNRPYYLDRSLRAVRRFRISLGRPAAASELEVELDQHRVTGVLIRWRGGGGHFVAITGVQSSRDGALVQVDDPRNGSTHSLLATRLESGYKGSGDWTATYFTKP